MKVIYTKHAKKKFRFLASLGWKLTKTDIRNALENPDYTGIDIGRKAEFVLKKIDERREIRVIYKKYHDIMMVITFYPTRKGRYV